jgi:hypothetical protein
MVDLTPNFAPEAYSQGVGTGSAQVFDLGAPNPFQVAQQNQEQTLANQKELNKKLIDYEVKKQERLDGFLEKYSDMTSEWGKTQKAIGDKVNSYGDLISGMRALNKSVDSESITKAQKELKDLAKQNEDNYKKYSKIGTEMTDINVYTDEERAEFEAQIDAANEKENPIQEIQKVVDTWQKSLATPDVVALYKKQKPEAKDKTGYLMATTEADAKQVVDNIWVNMKPIEKKKTLDRYVKEGKIDAVLADKFTDENGTYDLNNAEMEKKVGELMFDEVKPQMEYDKTPVTYSGGRSSGDGNEFNPDVPTLEPTMQYQTTSQNGGKYDTYVVNIPPKAKMILAGINGKSMAVQSGSVKVEMIGSNPWGLPQGTYITAAIDPSKMPELIKNTQKEAEAEANRLTQESGGAKFNVTTTPQGKFKVEVDETNNVGHFKMDRGNNASIKNVTKTKKNPNGFDILGRFQEDNGPEWIGNNSQYFWGSFGSGGSGGQGNSGELD